MADNKRSLSPFTGVYSELHQILTPDQCNQIFPLINSAVGLNHIDDAEIARQEQERLYYESFMDVDKSPCQGATSVNPNQLEEINADAAYAQQLQEEEYSKNTSFTAHKCGLNKKPFPAFTPDSNDGVIDTDAELAAHLQAEENKKRNRGRQHPPFLPPRRMQRPTTDTTFPLDEPEIIPIPAFVAHSHYRPSSSGNNNRNDNDDMSSFQMFSSRGRQFRGGRGTRDIQNNNRDFGPNDYENLLELDNSVGKKPLTKEQINRLPTEKFRPLPNKTDEENKCSICIDQFEPNQTLRRLPCLHVYHQHCIDSWLKGNNLCPICRMAPI